MSVFTKHVIVVVAGAVAVAVVVLKEVLGLATSSLF
jgi:hypothetical protein